MLISFECPSDASFSGLAANVINDEFPYLRNSLLALWRTIDRGANYFALVDTLIWGTSRVFYFCRSLTEIATFEDIR